MSFVSLRRADYLLMSLQKSNASVPTHNSVIGCSLWCFLQLLHAQPICSGLFDDLSKLQSKSFMRNDGLVDVGTSVQDSKFNLTRADFQSRFHSSLHFPGIQRVRRSTLP
jgi:hypothetical protein